MEKSPTSQLSQAPVRRLDSRVAKGIWAAVTIVGFVALVFGVDYYRSHYTETDTVTTVDTSDWAVYQNDIYGFMLRIPPTWGAYNVTKANRTDHAGEDTSFTYNYFHFEYPKRLEDEDSGAVFFEIGVFSSASWERARDEWKLLGGSGDAIFGGRSSDAHLAGGLEDRYGEIETIMGTFAVSPISSSSPSGF